MSNLTHEACGPGANDPDAAAAWRGGGIVITDERQWRQLPRPELPASTSPGIRVGRWRARDGSQDLGTETDGAYHVVGIALRRSEARLTVNGQTLMDGVIAPGMFNVVEPGARARCVIRGACDVLHIHVPNALMAECALDGQGPNPAVMRSMVGPGPDQEIERLGFAMLGAAQLGADFGRLYAESLGVAVVARLMASAARGVAERPRVSPLPKWRLRRALDYVETHLSEPVCLLDLASATGLTRMHFAAQFRAATGLRPHEYLLRRRIERAQDLLAGSATPVVEVALEVGFQTQSHFTSVFKRFAGKPPHAWRQEQRCAA